MATENVCASGIGLGLATAQPAPDDTVTMAASTARRPKQSDRLAPFPQADKYPIVIGQGLSLSYISSAFRLCNSGYRLQYVDVLNELLEKDPHAYSVVSKRVLTVGSGRVDIAAAEVDDPADRDLATEVAKYVKSELGAIHNFKQAQVLLAWATYYGVGAHEIVWGYGDDGQLHVTGLEFVHHRRLSYSDPYSWDLYVYDQGSPAMPGGKPGTTPRMGVYGIRCSDYPGKFIVHEPRVRGDYPTREGIGREIAYWMAIKNVATRLGPQYLERYAIPWPDLEFNTKDPEHAKPTPRIATDEEIAAAQFAAQAMGVGSLSNFVHSDAIKLNFAKPDGTPVLTVTEWVALCDSQMSKAALGATLTTDVGSSGGNRALGGVQKQGEEKLYEFDAVSLAASFDRDLVSWIVRNKYPRLPTRLMPKTVIHVNADPDPDQILARADKAARAGIPVDADAIAARCDIPVIPQVDPDDLDEDGRSKPGPDGKRKPQPRRMIPIANTAFSVVPETIGLPKPAAAPAPTPAPGDAPGVPPQDPSADPNDPKANDDGTSDLKADKASMAATDSTGAVVPGMPSPPFGFAPPSLVDPSPTKTPEVINPPAAQVAKSDPVAVPTVVPTPPANAPVPAQPVMPSTPVNVQPTPVDPTVVAPAAQQTAPSPAATPSAGAPAPAAPMPNADTSAAPVASSPTDANGTAPTTQAAVTGPVPDKNTAPAAGANDTGIPISKQNTASSKIADDVFKLLEADYSEKERLWIKAAIWTGPQDVPLDQIDWVSGDWTNVDPDHVQHFVKKYADKGGHLKPIILVNEPNQKPLFVADGHHRATAFRYMGIPAQAYVATVGTTGGQWEHMHTQQLNAHQPNAGEQAFVNEVKAAPTALAADAPAMPASTMFVLRHGEAGATIKGDPTTDGLRPLTAEGRRHIKALCDWMQANGKVPTAIYCSPLVRTAQTAQILADAFGLIAQPTEGLRIGETAGRLFVSTASRFPNERPLFVTHDHVIVDGLSTMGAGHNVDRPVMGELRILSVTNGDWTEVLRMPPSKVDPTAVDHLDITAK